jgi:hypothetical protein
MSFSPPPAPNAKCFVEVPNGSVVLSMDTAVVTVRLPNGTTLNYSPYVTAAAGSMRPCTGTEGQAGVINSYIESAGTTLSGNVWTYLYDEWTVPPAPTNYTGSPSVAPIDYLFDAIQNTNTIFQPMLNYGCQVWSGNTCLSGGGYWWMSAEAAGDGWMVYTTPTQVSSGDSMYGQITTSTVCSPDQGYLVTISDTTTSSISAYAVCASAGGGYGALAMPAALEAYHIYACNNLPYEGGGMNFANIASTPTQYYAWGTSITPNLSPSCNYGVSSSAGTVTLTFG